jgi:uncharacterized membrane protein YcaP (DUF421 family)
MLDMNLPWWEFIVRGAVVFCVLLLMVRVSGRRTVGQFTPFDLLIVMLLSEAVSGSLTGGDESVSGGLIIAATLVALNMLAAYLSAHSKAMSDMLDGTAVLLGRNGKIFQDVLKKCRLSDTEIMEALREADCKLEEMEYTFLEADGNITVQKKR